MSQNLMHELAEIQPRKPSSVDFDPIDISIKADHDKMRHLFQLYWDHPTAEIRQQLGWHMVRLVMSHASQEEEVLYPEFRRVLGDDVWKQHADWDMQLRQILVPLSSMNADKDLQAYDRQMQRLLDVLEPHMCQEEEWLNKLIMCPGVNTSDLGRKCHDAAQHAVTRPHWWAPPVSPPWDSLTKILISPLDHFLDWIRFAGHIPDIKLPDTSASTTRDMIETTVDTQESPDWSRKHVDLSPSPI